MHSAINPKSTYTSVADVMTVTGGGEDGLISIVEVKVGAAVHVTSVTIAVDFPQR